MVRAEFLKLDQGLLNDTRQSARAAEQADQSVKATGKRSGRGTGGSDEALESNLRRVRSARDDHRVNTGSKCGVEG